MAFHENQRATNATTAGFPRDFIFAKANGPAARVGETCEARWKGKWYQAEILAARDGKYQVTWPGWDQSYDSWVAPEDLRPAAQTPFADGTKLQIEWDGTWYAGSVVQSALGLLLVHYDGYTEGRRRMGAAGPRAAGEVAGSRSKLIRCTRTEELILIFFILIFIPSLPSFLLRNDKERWG